MTKDGALPTIQDTAWQLLAEFSAPGGPGSEDQPAERVTGAVQELGLQPAQVERIREAVVQAMRKATKHRNQVQHHLPVSVRIWISGPYTEDAYDSGSDVRQARHGWGFFLIQKPGDDPKVSDVASQHAIELFLYQEREHARNKTG